MIERCIEILFAKKLCIKDKFRTNTMLNSKMIYDYNKR